MSDRIWPDPDEMRKAIREEIKRSEALVYERGLRRGMAIAREYDRPSVVDEDVDWHAAYKQMEREIEEAKR